jgi:osmotically-inducible protein OsmY
MRKHLYSLALVAALTGSLAVAQGMPQQSQPQQNPSGMPPPSQQQPPASDQGKAPAASTTAMQSDIQSALQKDPSLASANINAKVSSTGVELTGTAPTKDAKDTAEQIAKAHSGGLPVTNHIKVAGPSK